MIVTNRAVCDGKRRRVAVDADAAALVVEHHQVIHKSRSIIKDVDAIRQASAHDEALKLGVNAIDPDGGIGVDRQAASVLDQGVLQNGTARLAVEGEIAPGHPKLHINRSVAYYYKGEYDKAWEDVHKAQSSGLQAQPEFLKNLREASGREK